MFFLLEQLAMRPLLLDGRPEPLDEEAAIQAQIQRLVAGRTLDAGGASAVVQWGLPSVVEMGDGDVAGLTRYAAALRQEIALHEPRLKEVGVAIEPRGEGARGVQLVISAVRVSNGEGWQLAVPSSR